MAVRRTVGQILIEFLKQRGVRYVFGVSGHSVFDITDPIYLEPDMEFVSTQIEISASYMAEGYARASRGLGVCLASSGAGATNLITGIAQAFKESSPVIALSADVARDRANRGASSWHEIPQAEIFRPITKMSVTLQSAEDVIDVLGEAYRQATTGRKGPVYIGIPVDLQTEEIEFDGFPTSAAPPAPLPPDPDLVRQVASELAAAKSLTIIAAGGVYWGEAEAELQALAELLHAPFGVPHSQKGLISEDHPLALGVLGFASYPYANKACLESDVILAVGTTFSEGMTLGYGHSVIPEGARIIQVDSDPKEIGKIYPTHIGIAADAKQTLQALVAELQSRGFQADRSSARMERIADDKRRWREEVAKRGTSSEVPINQWQLYHALSNIVDDNTLVVGEGGTGELLSRFHAIDKVHHSGDFRAIGHGMSTAIGVNYAFPDKKVVCVSGDGSFMMELQELATAARCGFPILFVVVHNDAYGNMKRDQIRHYGGRVIGTELNVPDLCALASSFGVESQRVERPDEIAPALNRLFRSPRPALLDVISPIEGI